MRALKRASRETPSRAAKADDPAEAVADFILARRIRREVIPICREWLDSTKEPTRIDDGKRELNEYLEEKYWVLTTIAEAYMGTDDEAQALALLRRG